MRINEATWIESRQRWQIKIQRDGQRKTFTSSTPGKKGKIEAERKADKWEKDRNASDNIRFGVLWADFIKLKQDTTGTANHKKLEQLGRLWLLPKLEHARISAIRGQDWQNCITAAYKKGLSKKTCENIRGAVTGFCRYVKRMRKIDIEIPDMLVIPKGAPVGERRILQPDGLKTLFSVDYITHYKKQVPAFFIHAWRFLVVTGLRRGELCGLKTSDLNGNVLTVRRSINSEQEETRGKTENSARFFVLNSHALRVLQEQRRMLIKAGVFSPVWLFPDEDGGRLDSNRLYDKWATYRKQHGIVCSLHELRHTFISISKADVPEPLIKRVVGHSGSMDTFGVYGHDVDGELERTAQLLGERFTELLDT